MKRYSWKDTLTVSLVSLNVCCHCGWQEPPKPSKPSNAAHPLDHTPPFQHLERSPSSQQSRESEVSKKGLAGRGGWREEILPMSVIQTSFLCPFSYATLRISGTYFWASICAVFWALLVANPLPPTPFRNLREKGSFARGGICRKFVANCAPSLRKIASISSPTSEEGCAKLSQVCQGHPFPDITRGFWCLVPAVDFFVDFPRWIFFGFFLLAEKINKKNPPKARNFLTKIHSRKYLPGEFVANLKVNFGQFYANTPFPTPPSENF